MQEKKDMYILGIESSCDETSVSVVKNGTEELATVISSQIDIHKDFGGANTTKSPRSFRHSINSLIPLAHTPSSFVIRINGLSFVISFYPYSCRTKVTIICEQWLGCEGWELSFRLISC